MLLFKEGQPEVCGIPAEAIAAFEKRLERQRVRIHGYMMLSGKQIVAERYYAPYDKHTLHRMYSVAKSFTALAVGLLVKNNLVKLTDKICDYFPEKLPEEGAHPWCAEMTIQDMLCMQTCHSCTTFKQYDGDDWTESFFRVKPDHVPGTVFSYDTSSTHVLCALVEKLTGQKMLDYMRGEMLNELGFSKEAYMIADPVGVSQGGSGLMCTLRDLAGVAYLCNHFGVLDGKELLPESFMREATANHVPTDLQSKLDEQFGYGYFIWMPREEGFYLFGMGGQLAVCFPQYDFCFLTMADTLGIPAGVHSLQDCFYDIIFPYLEQRGAVTNGAASDDNGEYNNMEKREEAIRQENQGKTYHFYPNIMGWEQVTFDWERGEMRFSIPTEEFVVYFDPKGQEWKVQDFLNTGYRCECHGYWKQGHFILQCFAVDEEQGNMKMDFAWKDSRLSVRIVSTSDPFINNSGLQDCFRGFASAEM